MESVVSLRVATQWGVRILADEQVKLNVQTHWNCRLRDHVVYPKRGDREPLPLWEICGRREAGDAEGEQSMVRMVLSEILFRKSPTRDRVETLRQIPAVLVTDCKAFYDGVVVSVSGGLPVVISM